MCSGWLPRTDGPVNPQSRIWWRSTPGRGTERALHRRVLRLIGAIYFCGIEEGDALFMGGADDIDTLSLVRAGP